MYPSSFEHIYKKNADFQNNPVALKSLKNDEFKKVDFLQNTISITTSTFFLLIIQLKPLHHKKSWCLAEHIDLAPENPTKCPRPSVVANLQKMCVLEKRINLNGHITNIKRIAADK